MVKLIWCFGKLEKTIEVDDNYIFPSYGDKVNEFNKNLRVVNFENRKGDYYVKLEEF